MEIAFNRSIISASVAFNVSHKGDFSRICGLEGCLPSGDVIRKADFDLGLLLRLAIKLCEEVDSHTLRILVEWNLAALRQRLGYPSFKANDRKGLKAASEPDQGAARRMAAPIPA